MIAPRLIQHDPRKGLSAGQKDTAIGLIIAILKGVIAQAHLRAAPGVYVLVSKVCWQDTPHLMKIFVCWDRKPAHHRLIFSLGAHILRNHTNMTSLDERDRRILTLLQQDSRRPGAELADTLGMSASALWRRIRTLEEAGIIERYGAVVNSEQMGLTFQAIVHVHLTRHDPDKLAEFIKAVEKNPLVQECFATTGQADYHLRVLAPDLAAYNRFLENFLFRLPAVASAQTNVVLRTIKHGQPIQA
jgi:DNA-binding Lrp family transcriptional regulator